MCLSERQQSLRGNTTLLPERPTLGGTGGIHTHFQLPLFLKRHPLIPFDFQQARMWWKTTQVLLAVAYELKIKKKKKHVAILLGAEGGLTLPFSLSTV